MFWSPLPARSSGQWWNGKAAHDYGFAGLALLILARRLYDLTPPHDHANDTDAKRW